MTRDTLLLLSLSNMGLFETFETNLCQQGLLYMPSLRSRILTVDGSEIPFPTTWDVSQTPVNSGISTTCPSTGFLAGFLVAINKINQPRFYGNPQVIAKLRAETLDVKPVILIAISHGFFPFFLFSFVAPWSNSNTNRRKHTEV